MNFQSISTRSVRSVHWLLLVTALLFAFVLAACGGSDEASATSAPAADTPAASAPATNTPAPAAAAAVSQTNSTSSTAPMSQTQIVTATKVPPPAKLADGAASKLDPAARNNMYKTPPAMTIDPKKYYYATLKTDRGDIKIQLFADRSPETVNNFVFLAREGFYNNTTFHRVLEGFMAQGGDPTGTGAGGPGYEFKNEAFPGLVFDREGLIAMANRGPDTNGSQFFITFGPTEQLNGGYTIFGEVVEGKEVLSKITRRDPQQQPNFEGDKLYTVLIEESDKSTLPPPTPAPPTATPTQTPTPFAPSSLDSKDRPLAKLSPEERSNHFNTAPTTKLDTSKQYTATIKTSKGSLLVKLQDDKAPIAVNNFVTLANLGFYDHTPINQISPDQAIVIGAPANVPTSDAGYKITAEVSLPITIDVGAIAYIPQRPVPNQPILSSSSQLLIALIKPPPQVNEGFSFFGQIISGTTVLSKLTMSDTVESITVAVSK